MKKTIAAAALMLGTTGCLGPNNLFNGLTNWNAFDRSLNGTDVFPVLRTTQEIR